MDFMVLVLDNQTRDPHGLARNDLVAPAGLGLEEKHFATSNGTMDGLGCGAVVGNQ
jgi:hypothetical protein